MSEHSSRGLVSLTAKVLPCERDLVRARAREARQSLSDWVAEACRRYWVATDTERINAQLQARDSHAHQCAASIPKVDAHPGAELAPFPATYADAIEEIVRLRSQLIRERKQLAEMVERVELAKRGAR